MSRSTRLLSQAVLKHDPQRHGLMQPHTADRKYHEIASAPTEAQLHQHLAGTITLATPATRDDQAACIVLDVDAEALTRVPLLIEAARHQGLWSWGEIHETRDRGYLHIPFIQLASAAALKQLGDTLITAAGLQHVASKDLDNRTMNQAITRLPFGVHTWTGQRGLITFPDGTSYDLNTQLETGLAAWCNRYTENAIPNTISSNTTLPALAAHQSAPAPRSGPKSHQADEYSPADIQRMYNERHDVCTILADHGGRRGSRQSWHCPCGQHAHNDAHGSLQIKAAKNPKYGRHIVQGFSASCAFFSDRQRTYDAFNVYATLNRLSNGQMLTHAREALGIAPTSPSRPTEREADDTDHHQRRRAPRPLAPMLPDLDIDQTRQYALQAFLSDRQLTKAAMRVYTYLYNHTTSLRCRPSIAAIAADTGMHTRTVQRALRQLEQHGHITTNHTENIHGDQTSIYTLRLPPAFSPSAAYPMPPAPPVPLAFSPPDIKACKGGASRPPAPPSLSVATAPPAPAAAGPEQLHGAKPIFPQKVTLQNICADEVAPNRAESASAAPSVASEPAPPAAAGPERTIVTHRRVFLRTVADLADAVASDLAAPPSAAPAPVAPRSVRVQSGPVGPALDPVTEAPWATFSPLPEGVYCDPDTAALRPQPAGYSGIPRTKSHQQLVAEQTASAARQAERPPTSVPPAPPAPVASEQPVMALSRPESDNCPDELAVMRDCVQRLRAAALVEKTAAAWGRYHREHARLAAQERHLAARVRRPEAPPLHAPKQKMPPVAASKKQCRMVQQSLGSML